MGMFKVAQESERKRKVGFSVASCSEQGRAGSPCFRRRHSSYIKPEARNSGQRGANAASLQYTCGETHVCENMQRHTETTSSKT